jgi:aspartate aminotransferase-like enzyme
MGLELLSKSPSNAVTAALVPAGVDGKKIIQHLRDAYSMTVAEGQDDYKGKMIRIAHLGYYDDLDVLTVLSAVEMTLKQLGGPVELGRGVGAAASYFLSSKEGQ